LNINTKEQFVRLYQRGVFGNRAPTWDGWHDWCIEHLGKNKMELFHIRNRVAGAKTWYDVPKFKMADMWAIACEEFDSSQLYISAMAPTEQTILQGEVQQTHRGLSLFYSTIAKPMRPSLLEGGRQVYGLTAVQLLRQHMCSTSYDWLQELLTTYDGHIVEFSCYAVNWGTVPSVNTVWWEVRQY
jgi:hypothetical protein